MLTIFTIPKPFKNPHIKIIQENAIRSWQMLRPKPEIILYGDDDGVDKIANELSVKHIPNVRKNEFGTPLLNDVFNNAQNIAANNILCYVNCDIILFQDFVETINIVKDEKEYILLGQRWDYDQKELIDFNDNWDKELKEKVINNGVLHPPGGSDYFVFKKGLVKSMPDFAVGRLGWDNWFIEYFIKSRVRVINCSSSIFIIHQNHDYSHKKINDINNDKPDIESLNNLKQIKQKSIKSPYSIDDVLYFIENGKIVYRKTFKNFKRDLFRIILGNKLIFYPLKIINSPFKLIKKLINKNRE